MGIVFDIRPHGLYLPLGVPQFVAIMTQFNPSTFLLAIGRTESSDAIIYF